MQPPSMSSIIRSILMADVNMPMDAVIQKARARGLKGPEDKIRSNIYNVRSEVKKALAKDGKPVLPASKPAPTPAAATPAKPAPAAPQIAPASAPVADAPKADEAHVFANLRLVSKAANDCGGADLARQVAKAVTACGGVEEFLRHLELVTSLQSH